jgi:UDP-2-acetamido-2-deoxy-ribo-hexuluronate aminotransferase
MKNILLDLNILLDVYENERRDKYPDSVEVFESLKASGCGFVSSSSLDNFEFMKYHHVREAHPSLSRKEVLYIVHQFIKEFLSYFKLAGTPSYLDLDYEDIEDSQIIGSAMAVDALVVTRDKKMLEKYPQVTISPSDYLEQPKPVKVDFANLKKQHFHHQAEISKAMDKVINSTAFIMGDAVKELEEDLQRFTGAKHAITCASGTDALLLSMMALGIGAGDEVITTPFTFIATAETIAFLGAKPVFVDIDPVSYNIDSSKIEELVTEKTKAIIPVSLYGQPADMDEIQAIADRNGLKVIVDGAQSFGATYKGKMDSTLGDLSCTSFFPAKPLGCYGDGGCVFTNDDGLAQKVRQLRVHGQSKRYHHQYIGMGGRMDSLQCAVVKVKLGNYQQDILARQQLAEKYNVMLESKGWTLPAIGDEKTSVYAQYSVRVKEREVVQAKLKEQGVPTAVHYPKPLHLQECFAYLDFKEGDFPVSEMISKEIMSLPMNPYISDADIESLKNKMEQA